MFSRPSGTTVYRTGKLRNNSPFNFCKMKQAILRDLLTENEIHLIQRTEASICIDWLICYLRVTDLSIIFMCLENKTGIVPAGVLSAHCINELTDRAIKKNLPIY